MSETLNEMCTSWLTNLNWASQSRWQISQLVTNKYQFCGCLTGPNSSWTWTFGIRYADWKNGIRCVQLGFGNVSGNDTKWSTPTTRCMNRAYLWKEHVLCYFMATKVGRWKKVPYYVFPLTVFWGTVSPLRSLLKKTKTWRWNSTMSSLLGLRVSYSALCRVTFMKMMMVKT